MRERKSARAFFTQQNTQTLTVRAGKIGNRGAIDVRKKETYQGRWGWILQGLTEGPYGIGGFNAAEHGVKLKLLDDVAAKRPHRQRYIITGTVAVWRGAGRRKSSQRLHFQPAEMKALLTEEWSEIICGGLMASKQDLPELLNTVRLFFLILFCRRLCLEVRRHH